MAQRENNTFYTVLRRPEGLVHIERLDSGKIKISVEFLNQKLFMPHKECETSYPVNLVEEILDVKGPQWLCDEIMRDEKLIF